MRSSQDYSFSRPPADTDNLTHDVGDGNVIAVPHPNQHLTTPRLHIGTLLRTKLFPAFEEDLSRI